MVSNASEIDLEGPTKKATKKGGAKGKK